MSILDRIKYLKQFKDNWIMNCNGRHQYTVAVLDFLMSVCCILLNVGFWKIVLINTVITLLFSLFYSIRETRDSIKHIVKINAVKSINRLFEKDK